MRKLAFGYATRCNIRCRHCVATEGVASGKKMDSRTAEKIIVEMARAGVGGISFSAGEPLLYFEEIAALVHLCSRLEIYTRVVTNSFWAKTVESSNQRISELKKRGLCQLRLSYSRWHQEHVHRDNVLRAVESCRRSGLDYFVSFVTDFSEKDEPYEAFLRERGLTFFPEPVIYAGRAGSFKRRQLITDYQANRCDMNPYLSPDLDMYACCDAGSHFGDTGFFYLGNLKDQRVDQLFARTETDRLFNLIRTMGITPIASFAGMPSREIITYTKCELCRKLFNSTETLAGLRRNLSKLEAWTR